MGLGARVAGIVSVVVAAVVVAGSPAAADDGAGQLKVTSAASYAERKPVQLVYTVTNTAPAACAFPTLADGAAQVLSVTRDGQALEPALDTSYYEDGLTSALKHSLITVQPGQTGQATLTSTPVDDGATADSAVLRSVTISPDGIPLDVLWPIGAAGKYVVTANFVGPALDGACTGVTPNQTVTFTVSGSSGQIGGVAWWWWAIAAVVALVLVAGAVILLRRRRPGPAAAALMMLAGLITIGGYAQPARASYTVDPNGGNANYDGFKGAVDGCIGRFKLAGDPAGVLKRLLDPNTPRVKIVPSKSGSVTGATPKSKSGPGSSTVAWNPENTDAYEGDVNRDPCSALYHELSHANDISKGTVPSGMCGDTGIRTAEVKATMEENKYRGTQQGKDPRKKYDGKDLPKSLEDCKKPKKPKTPQKGPVRLCENSTSCGKTNGDPHLATFDQFYYDFMAVGEFVVTRSTSGDPLEIQARQAPMGQSRVISVNSAVAFKVSTSKVSLALVNGATQVYVDGAATTMVRESKSLPGGGTLVRRESDIGPADGYDVTWPDGSAAAVDPIGTWGYRLLVKLASGRAGAVEGLLGNFDGDPSNDAPTPASFEKLYPAFADLWRVRDSLFTYPAGQGTDTFTDRRFPDKPITAADLDPARRAAAEQTCRDAGVSNPWQLAECVFDVTVTGRPEFALSSVATELVAAPTTAPLNATALTSGTIAPGQALTFAGRQGQAVYVDISGPTVPNQCGAYRLLDPTGGYINGGCNINGVGFIDRSELPVNGQYTVHNDATAGKATMRVYVAKDQTGPITPNGDAVMATLDQPGSVARFDFTGQKGQRVYVEVPQSSMGDQCGVLDLKTADGTTLAVGCIINGVGDVDGYVLPADGAYSIRVDPNNRELGSAQLKLYAAMDKVAPIAFGQPVTATIEQPGARLRYTFNGTTGQSVAVQALDATLPAMCSPLALVDPAGNTLSVGCVINGVGGIAPTTLPASGSYSLVVDPPGNATGVVTLTLR